MFVATKHLLRQKRYLLDDVPLVEFMSLVFTHMPGDSYCRWLRSLLLCLCHVFRSLINSLVCWFCTGVLGLALFQIATVPFTVFMWTNPIPRISPFLTADTALKIQEPSSEICSALFLRWSRKWVPLYPEIQQHARKRLNANKWRCKPKYLASSPSENTHVWRQFSLLSEGAFLRTNIHTTIYI